MKGRPPQGMVDAAGLAVLLVLSVHTVRELATECAWMRGALPVPTRTEPRNFWSVETVDAWLALHEEAAPAVAA